MATKFRAGCSGSGDLMTAEELFEILIMIMPEAEVLKSTFIKWVALPEEMKTGVESRLENLTATPFPTTTKEVNIHKGYSMSRILLRVFSEWSRIQDTLGAPGIQPGFTALPKRLEVDISVMIKCLQEVFEHVVREKAEYNKRRVLNKTKISRQEPEKMFMEAEIGCNAKFLSSPTTTPIRACLSDTAVTAVALSPAGDHVLTPPGQAQTSIQLFSPLSPSLLEKAGPKSNQLFPSDNKELAKLIENHLLSEDSDDTGVETSYDTEEDVLGEDDPDLLKYLTNVNQGHSSEEEDDEEEASSD